MRLPGKLAPAMAEDGTIRVGDRVVHLQVPGVFTVVGCRGPLLDIESARGLQMTVHQVAVRRLDGRVAQPKDA